MKRLVAIVLMVVAILGSLAIPTLVGAEPVEVEGKGVLAAKGKGTAEIEGKLEFRGNARAAVLVVEDRAGDARIDVWGYKQRIEEGNGRVRYVGVNGGAHIAGSDVTINLTGTGIRFAVRGIGSAVLKGHGTYVTKGGTIKPWTETGETIEFGN